MVSPNGLDPLVRAEQRDLRDRVAQHAGSDRVALGVVGVQEAVRRCLLDHLGELPSQVHRILHADVEALAAHRVVHVRGVAGQQHPPVAIGLRLPGCIGEPGDPGGTVDPVVGSPYGDERLAEVAQGGFAGGSEVLLGHHDPRRPRILRVAHLALRVDHVLAPAECMAADGVVVDAPFRLLGQLDLGDQEARRRLPPGEPDACCLADHAASAIAPDEVFRPSAAGRQPPRRRPRCRPARTPSRHVRDGSAPPTRRPIRRAGARCGSATTRARNGCRVGKSLMSNGVPANAATCAVCPSDRNRSAIPR